MSETRIPDRPAPTETREGQARGADSQSDRLGKVWRALRAVWPTRLAWDRRQPRHWTRGSYPQAKSDEEK